MLPHDIIKSAFHIFIKAPHILILNGSINIHSSNVDFNILFLRKSQYKRLKYFWFYGKDIYLIFGFGLLHLVVRFNTSLLVIADLEHLVVLCEVLLKLNKIENITNVTIVSSFILLWHPKNMYNMSINF